MIGHVGDAVKMLKTTYYKKNLLGNNVYKPVGKYQFTCIRALVLTVSGAGNVCFLRRSCTSGYKHETFRLCSSNLSCKYFLVSHRNFFHFQDG